MTVHRASLPIVDPPADPPKRVPPVRGIVLAAGTSDRFGDRNKLLYELDGESILECVLETLLASRLADVTVVLGHEADRIRRVASEYSVETVYNDAYADGQSTSLRTGIEAVRETDRDAALIALGDMPCVSVTSVDALLETYAVEAPTALATACDGRRGHPVLFDRRSFEDLLTVEGDVGGRDVLFDAERALLVETRDPGVRRDVDRPADLP